MTTRIADTDWRRLDEHTDGRDARPGCLDDRHLRYWPRHRLRRERCSAVIAEHARMAWKVRRP